MKTIVFSVIITLLRSSAQLVKAQRWVQVGKKGDWENKVAMDGMLYVVENGTLYRTKG